MVVFGKGEREREREKERTRIDRGGVKKKVFSLSLSLLSPLFNSPAFSSLPSIFAPSGSLHTIKQNTQNATPSIWIGK